MQRLRLAALLLVLVPALAFAADKDDKKPDDKKPDDKKGDLYPLAKGHKWEYDLSVGPQSFPATVEITEVVKPEKKDERTVYTLTTNVAAQTQTETISSDEKGVYRHAVGKEKLDTPVMIIKYPAKGGEKWEQKVKIMNQDATFNFETKDQEEVKVAAGTYKAYPITAKGSQGGMEFTAKQWYAEGVGLIKQEVSLGGITIKQELKKFTPAKGEK